MNLKKDDVVRVIAGDDRGETGKVLRIDRGAGKVVVEGVNRVYKHVRRSQRNPQGGRLSKEMPIPLSNVQLICSKCAKASRMGRRYRDNGVKERYCKSCGAGNGELSPARTSYAAK